MTTARLPNLPNLEDIRRAAGRIGAAAYVTPVLTLEELDSRTGGRIFIKAETLQRTGSFKFRGAMNKIAGLDARVRAKGVVAYSSGNHAQAVAAVAQLFGIPATIVMPSDAPPTKIVRTRHYGAKVCLYDREKDNREAIADRLTATSGATLVPPFEDREIISGQGTVGLELAAQVDTELDAVVAPASGGGLVAGIATAFAGVSPTTKIFLAEPEGFDDWGRSLALGHVVRNTRLSGSICDALLSPQPGELPFAINTKLVTGAINVSDDEVLAAIAFAYRNLKLVVEPGGAVALAALLTGKFNAANRKVGIVLSGGNVDDAIMARALATHD